HTYPRYNTVDGLDRGHNTLDHPHAPGSQPLVLLIIQLRGSVGKERDVSTPLAPQQRHVHSHRVGSDHSDGPIPNLPAMTVGAVQNPLSPLLVQPFDLRKPVGQSRGDQQASATHRSPVVEDHSEATLDLLREGRPPLPEPDPVSLGLVTADLHDLRRWRTVPGEEGMGPFGRG